MLTLVGRIDMSSGGITAGVNICREKGGWQRVHLPGKRACTVRPCGSSIPPITRPYSSASLGLS